MSKDTDEELSLERIRSAIRLIDSELNVDDVQECEAGTDTLYYVTAVTADDSWKFVLKLCTSVEPEAFRVEPYLLDVLNSQTSIPVPEVVGVINDHPNLPSPFFLMEHRKGEQVTENDLNINALGRVSYEAGHYLGELHTLGSFTRYGNLRCQRDDPTVRPGIVTDNCVLGVSNGVDSWSEWLLTRFKSLIDDVDERFRDAGSNLHTFVESKTHRIESDGPPVVIDNDYWYGNILVDSDTGHTHAVIDFGDTHTSTAEYNLALTEQFLCEFAPLDSHRRRRVRKQLYEGYEETNTLDRDEKFERRRDYYLATTWVGPLVLFDEWYAPDDPSERDELATQYRSTLSTLTST